MAFLWRLLASVLLSMSMLGCELDAAENSLTFVTRPGMGIDKWASIWLIKRHIAPDAVVFWLPDGEDSSDKGVLFDTEKALYKRSGQASTFSALVEGFNVEIDFLPEFVQLVHDVEINYWGPSGLTYSDVVEHQFRRLQAEFGQEKTPMACYMAFFDNLEAQMPEIQNRGLEELNNLNQLMPEASCSSEAQMEKIPRIKLVAEWPVETVLKALQQNKRVIFVDVRETDEFDEVHIPGAINVKIRELHDFDYNAIAKADLVVPYCVKDFRGFEMARLLKQNGIANVVLMRPYGLKGWISMGLPTAGFSTHEDQALKLLSACADNPQACLKSEKSSM